MSNSVHQQKYSEFLGVDLKADNVNRSPDFSPEGGQNTMLGPRGEVRKMPGVHRIHANAQQGQYFMKFSGYSQTNEKTEEIITTNDLGDYYKFVEEYITLVYAGAGVATFEVGAIDGTAGIFLYVNSALVYSNVSGSASMATLVAAISAVSGWTATFPGSGTMTLQGLYRHELTTLTTSSTYRTYGLSRKTIEGLNVGNLATTTAPSEKTKNNSSVMLNNVLFFTDISGNVMKYDGHWMYKAGLSIPTVVYTPTTPFAGSLSTTGYYTFAVRSKAIDYGGNTAYSDWAIKTVSTAGNTDITVAVSLVSNAGIIGPTLYLTPNALHTNATTINVTTDPRNDFRVGDKIVCCRYGNIHTGANLVQYATITANTASSITLDTAITCDPAYSEYLTHRVTVEVWRATVTTSAGTAGGPFYKIQEISCRQDGTSQSISTSDTGGGDPSITASSEIMTSIRRWNNNAANTITELPKAKYLATFQGSLILRDYTTENLIHFSDQEGPEQFDLAVNNFDVEGIVTALGSTKDLLAVFKEDNIDILVGDIKGYSVRVDRADDMLGCVSHETVKSIDDSSIYFLSKKGPYQIRSGNILPLGPHAMKSGSVCSRLEPFYTRQRVDYSLSSGADTPYLAMPRAVAGLWREQNLYLVYVPLESKQYYGYPYTSFPNNVYEVTCYPYDYLRGIWLPPWNVKANFMVNAFGRMFFNQRVSPSSPTLYYSAMYTASNTGKKKDFFTATGFDTSKYVFGWYSLDDPSQFKKFLRVRFFCHETVDNTTFSMDLRVEGDFRAGTYTTSINGITMTVGEEKKIKLSGQKARSIKITVESGVGDQDLSINGVVVEWTPVYRSGIKE